MEMLSKKYMLTDWIDYMLSEKLKPMQSLFCEIAAQRSNVVLVFYMFSNTYNICFFMDVVVFHVFQKTAT